MKNIVNKLNRIAVFLGLLLGAFAISVLADWTPPAQQPPGGNVAAPLNVDKGAQTKAGGLWLQGLNESGVVGTYSLVTENVPMRAKGGIEIETRTSDPTSPADGRMWLIVPTVQP